MMRLVLAASGEGAVGCPVKTANCGVQHGSDNGFFDILGCQHQGARVSLANAAGTRSWPRKDRQISPAYPHKSAACFVIAAALGAHPDRLYTVRSQWFNEPVGGCPTFSSSLLTAGAAGEQKDQCNE
jgi:hypothetical protein